MDTTDITFASNIVGDETKALKHFSSAFIALLGTDIERTIVIAQIQGCSHLALMLMDTLHLLIQILLIEGDEQGGIFGVELGPSTAIHELVDKLLLLDLLGKCRNGGVLGDSLDIIDRITDVVGDIL